MDIERVGRRIKAFRKLKGYTQIDFAKALHVSISELRSIERGLKEAPEVLLEQISDYLAVSTEELIGEVQHLKEAE